LDDSAAVWRWFVPRFSLLFASLPLSNADLFPPSSCFLFTRRASISLFLTVWAAELVLDGDEDEGGVGGGGLGLGGMNLGKEWKVD